MKAEEKIKEYLDRAIKILEDRYGVGKGFLTSEVTMIAQMLQLEELKKEES